MESVLVAVVWIGLFIIGPPAVLMWMVRRRRRREREAREAAVVNSATDTATVEAAAAASAADAASGTSTAMPSAPTGQTEQTGQSAAADPANAAPPRLSYTFPYGVPLVSYTLLAIALAAVQRTWLAILLELFLIALAGAFTHEAFNRTSYEKVRANDPSMGLLSWRINWLVFFALPPAVLALFGVGKFLSR